MKSLLQETLDEIEVTLKNQQGAEIRSRTGYMLGRTGN